MLIVSKFHDYYDTATAYGVDKTVVYLRKQEDIEIKRKRWDDNSDRAPGEEEIFNIKKGSAYFTYKFYKRYIGFCGRIYPFIEVNKKGSSYPYTEYEAMFFYEAAEFIEYLNEEGVGLGKGKGRYYWGRDYSIHNERDIVAFFNSYDSMKHLEAYFQEKKAPVFAYGKYLPGHGQTTTLMLNPPLKAWKFAKIKDPVSAFQDIYMFISGVLGTPERPMVEISDKDKAAAKGHDGKYSFRKPPGTKGNKPRWR